MLTFQGTCANDDSEQYTYDVLQRLTNSTVKTGNTNTKLWYEYDNLGNRNRQNLNGAITTYGYYLPDNELTSSVTGGTTTSYQYNYVGGMTSRTVGTSSSIYTFDVPGRLVKVASGGVTMGAYGYDAKSRQVVSVEGSTTTFYAYVGTETLYENKGGTSTDYVYAAGLRLARVSGSTVSNFHTDHLGSTRLITDNSNIDHVLFSDGYQPFGQDNGIPSGSETIKFTGKTASATTGLYYEYQRWYDPSVGRFLSRDPLSGGLADPQSSNPYVYVENVPTILVDPTGAYDCYGPSAEYCDGYIRYESGEAETRNPNAICEEDAHTCALCSDNPFLFHCNYEDVQPPNDSGSGTSGETGSSNSAPPRTITITASDTPTPSIDTITPTEVESQWPGGDSVTVATPGANEFTDSVVQENGGYTGESQEHHLLPHEFDEHYFDPKGLNIDDYTMRLDSNLHRIIHGKGIGYENSWNFKWQLFIDAYPDASIEDILSYAYELAYGYGLLW